MIIVSLFACRPLFCLWKSFLFLHVGHSPRPQPPSWRAWDASSFCAGTRWKLERTVFRFFFCILQFNVHQCLPLFAPLDQSDEETWPEKKTKKKTRRGWDAYSFSAGAQWQIKLLSLLFYVLTHRQAVSTNENWNEILLHQCSVQNTSWNDTVMKHTTFSFPGRFSPLLWHMAIMLCFDPKSILFTPRPPNEINMWFGL